MTTVWVEVLSDDILKHWRQYRLNTIYIQLNRRKHLLNSRAIRHFQPSFAANTRQPPKIPRPYRRGIFLQAGFFDSEA